MGISKKKLLIILGCAAVLFVAILVVSLRRQQTPQRIISYAREDTYIEDSEKDVTHNTLELKASSGTDRCSTVSDCSPNTTITYIKFSLAQKPDASLNSIRLRLYVNNPSNDGGQVYLIGSNWSEQSLTWNNAPDRGKESIGSFGPVQKIGWYETDLPISYFSQTGTYSIAISSKDSNPVGFDSKENAKHRPYLFFQQLLSPINSSNAHTSAVAVGDISCDENQPKTAPDDCQDDLTANLIPGLKPDSLLLLGDLQYEDGQYDKFVKYYDKNWGKFKDISKPSPGNHEYYNSTNYSDARTSAGCETTTQKNPFSYACGYYDYFDGKSSVDGIAGKRGEGYYAFDQGNWRIYSLNSNCTYGDGCTAGSKQEHWLRTDLALHPNQCKLMYMHHPFVASDPRNFDAYYQGLPDPSSYLRVKENMLPLRDIYKAFYDYHGDLVLAGHSHMYERFAKQNLEHNADDKGFTEIVVGTGGRYTYGADLKHLRPLSQITSKTGDQGVLSLDLSTDSFSWGFKPVPGIRFTDSGTQTCNYVQK